MDISCREAGPSQGPSRHRLSTTNSSSLSSNEVRSSVSRQRITKSTPRVGRSTAIFVLSLCLPYVAAGEMVSVELLNDSHFIPGLAPSRRFPSSSLRTVIHSAAAAIGKLASRYLITGRGPDGKPPVFTFVASTISAIDELPDDFVLLNQIYNPGFIVLSYLIAFVGSLCTLELLIRRTSNRGFSNQILLAFAGCCFGAVSTFAMHFVGNNSLSLHHPQEDQFGYQPLYLSYGAGFTVLSLFTSCIAMTLAFFVMGTQISDWACFPGHRRKRRTKRTGRTAGDDYRRWKAGVQKRPSKVASNAFWQSLSVVSQWSMLDGLTKEQSNWRATIAAKAGKGEKWNSADDRPWIDEEEEIIRRDKELDEMDFRKGRAAVRVELERRYGTSNRDSTESRSLRHMASDASLIRSLPPLPTTDMRNTALMNSFPDTSVFSAGYNFPPKVNADLSAAISSGQLGRSSPDKSCSNEYMDPSHPGQLDFAPRRASLPVVSPSLSQTPKMDHPSTFKSGTLSRIQSLPEADVPESELPSRQHSRSGDIEEARSSVSKESLKLTDSNTDNKGEAEIEVQKLRGGLLSGKHASGLEKFLGLDVVTRADIIKIVITGFTAGLGVAAMHYIGQLSIVGLPYIAYKVGYVVGSVIIACGAVIIALYIMFIMLRPKLKHDWYLKILVAFILATAVCAMHYTGMRGTIYAWPNGSSPNDTNLASGTKVAILALVASLAFVACLAVAGFVYYNSRQIREEKNRRRRVVVAHVAIDPFGRILVNSSDGMLPMCDITSLTAEKSSRNGRTLDSSSGSTVLGLDLTTHHEAFVSALRMSWSWRNPLWSPNNVFGGVDVGAGGQGNGNVNNPSSANSHASASMSDVRRGSAMTAGSSSNATGNRPLPLSISKFLEKFANSSVQLALRLTGQHDGVSRLGVLYDQILTTGWVKLSNSTDTVSKGQLLFLVRRVLSNAEQSDLLARHFIFADPSAVAGALHKTLSVPLEHTLPLLEDIRVFCDSTAKVSLKSGTLYTGVAVVQATPFDGLRILCEPENRSQLPLRELCTFGAGVGNSVDELSGTVEEIGEALTWLDGMTLWSIITRNMATDNQFLGGRRVANLLHTLERALVPMLDEILSPEDMAHVLPRLILHPVLVPLTPGGTPHPPAIRRPSPLSGNSGTHIPPYLIVFYANYDAAVNTFTDKWLPFSLFRAQNACVMSAKIQAASKIEHSSLVASAINAERESAMAASGGEGMSYNYARRPSKVQFEFPQSNTDMTSVVSGNVSSGNGYSQPPASSTFGTFTFPARPSSADGNVSSFNPVPSSPKFPFLPKSRALEPRRSSLRSSAPNTDAEPDYEEGNVGASSPMSGLVGPSSMGVAKDTYAEPSRSPGVAYWNPEWLLHLLRNKLRADA